MTVIFNQTKCDLDIKVSKEEEKFLKKIKEHGFVPTYYAQEDVKGGSIEKLSLKLKSPLLK